MTPAPSAHPGEPLPEGVVSTGAGDALVICHGLGELSRRAADYLVRCLHENVAARGTAVMVLAGGSTPQPVYQAMASADLPWERIWFT
ncbi:MAG: 6-phosphogluconolactonase, partial [Acidobacteriota bacterium]